MKILPLRNKSKNQQICHGGICPAVQPPPPAIQLDQKIPTTTNQELPLDLPRWNTTNEATNGQQQPTIIIQNIIQQPPTPTGEVRYVPASAYYYVDPNNMMMPPCVQPATSKMPCLTLPHCPNNGVMHVERIS